MTIYEWLGENNKLGIDIWKKKYQYNDETFEQWLDRVSGGDNDVKQLIKEKKFLYGGRILANRNVPGKKTLSNCFLPGTQVLTEDGYKNIEDILEGERVLSDDGLFHRVNKTMSRKYSGDIYKLSNCGFKNGIYCTPNHKFLTEAGWKAAEHLVIGQDKIQVGGSEQYVELSNVEIMADYVGFVHNLSVEDTHNYVVEGVVAHNCYVLEPPRDNLESIFDTAKKLARTFSYGGGVGIDLGKLCPEGAKVNNTAKQSTGAVSFMELFNTTTGLIGQNGRRKSRVFSLSEMS